jgi:hypothetical protein
MGWMIVIMWISLLIIFMIVIWVIDKSKLIYFYFVKNLIFAPKKNQMRKFVTGLWNILKYLYS